MKAYKLLLLFSVLILFSNTLESQQLFRSTQYVFNPYLMNPAMAGTKTYSPINVSYRQQWAGFESAPTTMTLSGHTNLPNSLGAGLIIFSDDTGGAISRTGAEVTGSYKIDLNNEDQISFGLSAIISTFQFDNSDLLVRDLNDPNLAGGLEKNTAFDANFGLVVFGKQYFYGFSIYNLIQTDLKVTTISNIVKNQNTRHFHVMGSYDYEVDDKLTFQPSGLLRFTGVTPTQFDIHLKGIYQENFWVGMSYRHQDAIAASFGFKVGDFSAGYSYDITTTSALRDISPHTHEINLAYDIPRGDPRFREQGKLGKRRISRSRLK